jgi:esterase/lipase superfamily enzyme
VNREYHRWHSPSLGRDMELLIYGHGGAKVLVFPTRDGRFHEYEDLHMTASLAPKIDAGQLQLFCVDGVALETFYCPWRHPADRIRRYLQYEDYVLNEVFPLMRAKNDHPCTIAHGCSMGAFSAANLAFRHPHLFRKLCAFSGRYDLTHAVEQFHDVFDGYYDEDIYFNTPIHYLANLHDCEQLSALRSMEIVFCVGRDDPFFANNQYLSRLLWEKGVPNQFHEWDGRSHQGGAWRRMAPLYL